MVAVKPDVGWFTTIHLGLLAALAVLVVFGIVWGARLKRRRAEADQQEAERIEADAPADISPDVVAPEATRREAATPAVAPPPAPPPLAPSPPPLDDAPVVAAPPPALAEEPAPQPAPIDDEPVAAAAPQDASPAAEAHPEPIVEAPGEPVAPAPPPPAAERSPSLAGAPVTRLKGLGPKVAARMAELGITTVGQLADLDQAAAEHVDARLGPFTGRMARDRWIEQARLLAAGDVKGFEAAFGRLS